jgi:aspartyl aminopeptidase
MHSIREMCGTEDITSSLKYFVEFYSNMSRLESNLDVDSLLPPNILGEMADTPCGHVH